MSCSPPTVTIGGVTLSTNDFENARELLQLSGDLGDPTLDGFDESVAGGNNTSGTTGIQFPAPTQSAPPKKISLTSSEEDLKPAPGGDGIAVVCYPWNDDYDLLLSDNYKVRDFSIGALWKNPIIDVAGASKTQRVCNLKALAVNIAEPIRSKFGPFRINSAIRNNNSVPNGLSQHVLGQAMDIQFEGWTYEMYWKNAVWIRDHIKFDQFIFEHSSSTGLAWYHLSYNPLGNRSASLPTKVMTMYRNGYDTGLKKFA